MKALANILPRFLGVLLLTAAVLKGWHLLTEPVANSHIWSYRPLRILTVELELALAIWLLSGLFKKAAWLAALLCFSAFSAITLYKTLTGAASCGPFAPLHINPWITLSAIHIPAVTALAVFRPKGQRLFVRPPIASFAAASSAGIVILTVTAAVLAYNEPAEVASPYEILEPETWVGKKPPILDYINIGSRLKKADFLVLFYHHDCPDCRKKIRECEQIAHSLTPHGSLQVALIEVPPYGKRAAQNNASCFTGRLLNSKEWVISTPAAIVLSKGVVVSASGDNTPILDALIEQYAAARKNILKGGDF